MSKYLVRYLIFLAPALLASYLLDVRQAVVQIILWFLGFVFLICWTVSTGMFAYNSPRGALAFIFGYFGLSSLLIRGLHQASFRSAGYLIFDHVAGAITYRPLYMLYLTLVDSGVMAEMWVAGIVAGCCLAGFLCGLVYRQIRPNPYRPTFSS
ncbi:MAG: hypothetical protein FWE32_03715 [Oscillospiraceae bacterium]|nr:hypothetical protein [Oscillospiraceae bacterium]